MDFFMLNLVLMILCTFVYIFFRDGLYSYCRLFKKTSKTFIRKNIKGASNFWLFSQLHKQVNLGILYYLNLIYLFLLIAFLVSFALSWISSIKILVIIFGLLLSLVTIPVFGVSLFYSNIDTFGKPFIIYKYCNGYKEKSRGLHTIFEWLFALFPLALYIYFLMR